MRGIYQEGPEDSSIAECGGDYDVIRTTIGNAVFDGDAKNREEDEKYGSLWFRYLTPSKAVAGSRRGVSSCNAGS